MHVHARRSRFAAAGLATVVLLSACGGSSGGSTTPPASPSAPASPSPSTPAATPEPEAPPEEVLERVTVTIASSGEESFEGRLAYQVARAKGYFDEQGIDIVDVVTGGGGASSLQPLVAGQANIAFLSLSTTLQAVEQGRDVRLGASTQIVNTWLPVLRIGYLDAKGIDYEDFVTWDPQDRWDVVRGATFASGSAGGLNARAVTALGRQFGLDVEQGDFTIVPLPGAAVQTATLRRGRIDGLLVTSPENQLLVEDGSAVYLLTREELIEHAPSVAFARNAELILDSAWAEANPDVATRFFAAYQKGADFITAHSAEEVVEVLLQVFPDYPRDRAVRLVEDNWANTPKDSKATVESLEAQIDFAVETGAISAPVPVELAYDFRWLPEPNLDQEW